MSNTSFDDRINSGLDTNTTFAHKIGNWPEENSWHDCGILLSPQTNLIVCLMSKNTTLSDFKNTSKNLGQYISQSYMF
jgi:hypothetical protein